MVLGSVQDHADDGYPVIPAGNTQAGDNQTGLKVEFSFTVATESGLLMMQLMTARRSSIKYVLPYCFLPGRLLQQLDSCFFRAGVICGYDITGIDLS